MKRWCKRVFAVVVMTGFIAGTTAFAQDTTVKKRTNGPRRQLATIVFSGLGGAILGLSTLSFYGRPQDNLANIAVGFAAGVIAGTAYVTFRTATTKDYYDEPKTENQGTSLDPQELPHVIYGPMITRVTPDHAAFGGQLALLF